MVGTVVSSPGTTTHAGQGGSANPVVVTKWVQPPSAPVSDPLGPSSIDKSREPFREACTHGYAHSTSNATGEEEGERGRKHQYHDGKDSNVPPGWGIQRLL